jgi:hypothetical protein
LVSEEGADMTLPEYALPKRRRQILDNETDMPHLAASEHADASHEDIWVGGFMTRLAALIRNLHRKK